ncbi:F-box/SPRY domain-containing protein 1-like [Panicum virgatum]|uniref:F-box domain-containing protein n=1 Tax=Panicum virgatum TaxID=38727 RepID=A0A8T0VHE3_PANVG|nr:F-box/SPRY domain-containing protein 1-like [Panicum virgatum]KAG2634660.1 hypothetical protein PVAP13_2NG172100 [Panicum virgatum]
MPPPLREEEGGDSAAPAALRTPAHVMARVFSQLDCIDLLSCSLVCKQWYHDSAELREEWRKEYLDAWNQFGLSVMREAQPLCLTCSLRSLHSLCP